MRTDTLRSGLIGAVIAAVIWIVIAALTGADASTIWVVAVILLVGTFVVSVLISTFITKRQRS